MWTAFCNHLITIFINQLLYVYFNIYFRLPYTSYYGGVSQIPRNVFEAINGNSNQFFGWGGEDDDLWNRLVHM